MTTMTSMTSINVKVVIDRELYEDGAHFGYAKAGDAGIDLRALCYNDIDILPGHTVLVPTGVKIAIGDDHYEAQVRPRSGLALKHSVTVLNTPGTIDSGYTGEIGVILINHHPTSCYSVKRGERIAQLVFNRIERPTFTFVDELVETERGSGGFGSTGTH